MFENILYQDDVVGSLSRDLLEGSLPPSLLFWGEAYSGKLTCALELARVLSCEKQKADWNCPCPSCERHRTLSHPDILLMGDRPFMVEIRASLDMLSRERTKREKLFFVRSVRKLERRFDPVLFEGEESRLAKAVPFLDALSELLQEFSYEFDSGKKEGLSAMAEKISAQAERLAAHVQDSVPIFQIRNAAFWARLSPLGRKKTMILEGADVMLESSRNALLKILEEPPSSLQILLLASKRRAIMPTILSRVRPYGFRTRTQGEVSQILSKIFRRPNEKAPDLGSWFSSFGALPMAEMERLARSFLATLLSEAEGRVSLHPALSAFLSEHRVGDPQTKSRRGFESLLAAGKGKAEDSGLFREIFPDFLGQLGALSSLILRRPEYDARLLPLIEAWSGFLGTYFTKMKTLNMNPSTLVESLYYDMREAALEAAFTA